MATEPSQAASGASDERPLRALDLAREFGAALRFLALGRLPDAGALPDLARGGAFFPAIGLGLGLLVGGASAGLARAVPIVLLAPIVVAALTALQGGRRAVALFSAACPGTGSSGVAAPLLGSAVLAVVLAVQALAVAALDERSLAIVIGIAAMLGRWAMVVQAYGSVAEPNDAVAAAFVRDMKFREFAVGSVSAMALTLVLANAVGLVLLFVAATGSVTARIVAHRISGGVSSRSIGAGSVIVETLALVCCAALVRWLGAAG